MHQDTGGLSMNAPFTTKWRMVVHRDSGRIAICTPAEHFKLPSKVVIVLPTGVQRFNAAEFESRDWDGALPKGFTSQTSFRFRFQEDRIVEVDQVERNDAVVL